MITEDSANAVGRRGISPDVFHTVDQITHSEMSAAELKAALDRTLGRSSATGGKNFAETVNDLSQPDSRYEYGRMTGAGTPNDVSQKVADIALTARQSYTPPVQGGLRSAISSATQHGAAPVISTMLANLAHQYGLGPYIASATAAAGALPFAKRMIASEYMQSPGVRNAMLTGQRTPYAHNTQHDRPDRSNERLALRQHRDNEPWHSISDLIQTIRATGIALRGLRQRKLHLPNHRRRGHRANIPPATSQEQSSAGIRRQPLQPQLVDTLNYAAQNNGVRAHVYSGGQPAKGQGWPRTGSTRHDLGGAADLRRSPTPRMVIRST